MNLCSRNVASPVDASYARGCLAQPFGVVRGAIRLTPEQAHVVDNGPTGAIRDITVSLANKVVAAYSRDVAAHLPAHSAFMPAWSDIASLRWRASSPSRFDFRTVNEAQLHLPCRYPATQQLIQRYLHGGYVVVVDIK